MGNTKRIIASFVIMLTIVASVGLAIGIGQITKGYAQSAATVSVTDFSTPAGADPWGEAFDSSGRVWVAMPGCDPSPKCSTSTPPGKLVVYDPGTSSWVKTISLPSGYGQPLFLAFDHSGRVWFSMPVTNAIAVYDPAANTFKQWGVPTSAAGPWGIAVDGNGIVWFAEHYGNKIGSFNPSTQAFKEIATPATNSQPYGITVDSANNVWFTENTDAVALIAEYAGGTLKEYKIRNSATSGTGLTPHLITVDPNGDVWWTEGFVHSIGVLRVASAQPGTNNGVKEYQYSLTCSNCGAHTSGISVDKKGQVWFDDSLQSIFSSFPINGTGTFSIYNTPSSNSHPHDGLAVDSQNRIWFAEEFANKLARAIQPAGSPTPTTTITPTATTPTSTPTPGTALGTDTFQRANQALWGTASDSQTWGGDANSVSSFSIASNAGLVKNTTTSYSAVLGNSASNEEVTIKGSISSFSSNNFGAVVRWTSGNSWYKAYLDGTNLIVQSKVNGTATIIKTVAFAATAGTSYSIHFRVVGTTLTANAWASSGSEPSGWMASITDSSLPSGACGLRVLAQNATLTVTSVSSKTV